jgi:hypothetical protein
MFVEGPCKGHWQRESSAGKGEKRIKGRGKGWSVGIVKNVRWVKVANGNYIFTSNLKCENYLHIAYTHTCMCTCTDTHTHTHTQINADIHRHKLKRNPEDSISKHSCRSSTRIQGLYIKLHFATQRFYNTISYPQIILNLRFSWW